MNSDQKTEIWNGYFYSDVYARYFNKLADSLKSQTQWLSILLGILSSGPVATMLMQPIISPYFGLSCGVIAACIGVYIASSNLSRKTATAIRCAIAWNEINKNLGHIWLDANAGKDVWDEYKKIDKEAYKIDDLVISELSENRKLFEKADEEARHALPIAA